MYTEEHKASGSLSPLLLSVRRTDFLLRRLTTCVRHSVGILHNPKRWRLRVTQSDRMVKIKYTALCSGCRCAQTTVVGLYQHFRDWQETRRFASSISFTGRWLKSVGAQFLSVLLVVNYVAIHAPHTWPLVASHLLGPVRSSCESHLQGSEANSLPFFSSSVLPTFFTAFIRPLPDHTPCPIFNTATLLYQQGNTFAGHVLQ